MKTSIVVFIVLVILLVGLWFVFISNEDVNKGVVVVANFEECATAGYAIMESYPRQCRESGGRIFTEDIGNELIKHDLIRISAPRPTQSVRSPLLISGDARGVWYFEASFPVELLDEQGNLLAGHYAEAQSEWMTTEFVPFRSELQFFVATKTKAILLLKKDNPSGEPQFDDELRVPLILEP